MDPSKQKKQELSPAKTLLMLECGYADLNFDEPIEQAIFIVGSTRAGKTTLLHYLLHSQLIGVHGGYGKTGYKVKATSEVLKKAVVGENERQSQTQIPNVVKVKTGDKWIYLIDLPGYHDTYGCFRAVSNILFTQKIFSQAKNIKFVIVTDYSWLRDTALSFKITMKSFLNTFKNVNTIDEEIASCICMVVTKCPSNVDRNTLIGLIQELNIGHTQYDPVFAVIKRQLLKNKAIFKFSQAVLGQPAENSKNMNNLLDQINKTIPNWWTRKIDPTTKKVNMDKIKVHLLDVLAGDQKRFKTQLEQFSLHLQKMFDKYLKKQLVQIVKQFLKDPHSQKIDQFVNIFNNVIKQQTQINKNEEQQYLQTKYDEKWRIQSKKMFALEGLSLSNSFNLVKETPLSLQKMKAFNNIHQVCKIVSKIQNQRYAKPVTRILKQLKNLLEIIIGLIRKQQQKQSNQMKLYAYKLYMKILLISDMFFMFNKTVEQSNKRLKAEQFDYICIKFPSNFKKLFTQFQQKNQKSHLEVAMEYIQKINSKASYQNIKVYDDILRYLENIQLEFRSRNSDELNDMRIDHQKLQKYYGILDRKNKQVKFMQIQTKIQSVQRIGQNNNLVTEINDQQAKILQKADDVEFDSDNCYEQCLCSNYEYSHLLGSYAMKKRQLDVALALYQQLNDAYQVIQILKLKQQYQKIQTAEQKQEMMNILIEFMRKAYKYNRMELAIEKAQKAFSFAQMIGHREKIEQIGKFLYRICPSPYEDSIDDQDQMKDIILEKRKYMEFVLNGVNKVSLKPMIIDRLKSIEQKQMAEKSPKKQIKMQSTTSIKSQK